MKPVQGGWKVFETPVVETVFVGPDSWRQAIDYAKTRQGFSQGEIPCSIVPEIVETIPFDDREDAIGRTLLRDYQGCARVPRDYTPLLVAL